MSRTIPRFLLFEGATYVAASLIHRGVLISGYQHQRAATAETVIGAVVLAGLAVALLRPGWTRVIGPLAQGFALLGTLVGIFTIAIGVGPRTVPDLAYHVGIVLVLVYGLVVTARMRGGDISPRL